MRDLNPTCCEIRLRRDSGKIVLLEEINTKGGSVAAIWSILSFITIDMISLFQIQMAVRKFRTAYGWWGS